MESSRPSSPDPRHQAGRANRSSGPSHRDHIATSALRPQDISQTSCPNFNPFPGEPTLLDRLGRHPTRRAFLLMAPVTAVAIVLFILALQEHPQQPIAGRICADLRRVWGMAPAESGFCALPESTSFPLTRDIYSLVAALMLATTPIAIARQWTAYTNLLSQMASRGAMRANDDTDTLRREVAEANRRIRSVGRLAPITMLVVAAAITELIAFQSRHGVFQHLAPPGAGDQAAWTSAAYDQWWASQTVSSLGHITYFVVATWSVYIATQQNLVGFYIMRALWRSRHSLDFGADPVNTDGYFGWSSVRTALAATYTELAMHGIALACVAITVPPGSLTGPMVIASFQWLISLVVHLAFPFVFVHGKIRIYKERELGHLMASLENLDSSLPEYERIAIQNTLGERMAIIRTVPTLPFKSLRDSMLFSTSVIADSAAVVALLVVFT
jgi:hypothetical protein